MVLVMMLTPIEILRPATVRQAVDRSDPTASRLFRLMIRAGLRPVGRCLAMNETDDGVPLYTPS